MPGGDETAENGHWSDVPGREFFTIIRQRLGQLRSSPKISVRSRLRSNICAIHCFPGMHILQYAFGGDAHNRDLPHNYIKNCVAYTGTHDNDTTVGWYKAADKNAKAHCRKYLQTNGREIHWNMIRAAFASVADTAIVPMQDILGLGGEARMNTPATESGNWSWRMGEIPLAYKPDAVLALKLDEAPKLLELHRIALGEGCSLGPTKSYTPDLCQNR